MYCTECGSQQSDNSLFCTECGAPLSPPSSTSNEETTQLHVAENDVFKDATAVLKDVEEVEESVNEEATALEDDLDDATVVLDEEVTVDLNAGWADVTTVIEDSGAEASFDPTPVGVTAVLEDTGTTTRFENPPSAPAAAFATAQMPVAQASADDSDKQKNYTWRAIGIALLVIVIGTALVVLLGSLRSPQRGGSSAVVVQMEAYPINISFKADGYTDQCTKIPVSIVGTDAYGASVDTVGFMDASGTGVSVAAGDYTLSFPASPLTTDGVLYQPPTVTAQVSVSANEEEGTEFTYFEAAPATFNKLTALDQTDEMIDTAYEYAIMDSSQTQLADRLKEIAVTAHSDAITTQQQQNAAQAAKAARTIDMQYYTLTIPEYWVGKIDVIKDGNDVLICPKGGTTESCMVDVELVPQSYDLTGGDYISGLLTSVNTSGGYRAELYNRNWPGTVPLDYSTVSLPASILESCVQLETGGAVTVSQIRNDTSASSNDLSMKYARIAYDYMTSNIVLTAK